MGQRVEKRCLSGAGPPAYKNVVARSDKLFQKLCRLCRERSEADQILHGNRMIGKTTYRDDRTIQRHRRQHNVDTRSVFEPCIGDRGRLVDYPVALCHDLLYYVFELFPRLEAFVPLVDVPRLLDKNIFCPVYHDLRHLVAVHQLLEHIHLSDGMKHTPAKLLPLFQGQGIFPAHLYDQFIDHFPDLEIIHLPRKVDLLPDMLTDIFPARLIPL